MKTSPTTSSCEQRLRAALLDVLHAQWRALGVPFSAPLPTAALEVVDPEALLWCSLEFFADEPRLAEGVSAWVSEHRTRLITQRLNKLRDAAPDDPRSERWRWLDHADQGDSQLGRDGRGRAQSVLGDYANDSSSLFLRARDLFGRDCRSFLIVFLVAAERGIRLREVTDWTGYAYRSVADAATGLERAGAVRIQHGHCLLLDPTPWRALLRCETEEIVTVDWPTAFAAAVDLLRTLSQATALGLTDDHALIVSAVTAAKSKLEHAAAGRPLARTPALHLLRTALARP